MAKKKVKKEKKATKHECPECGKKAVVAYCPLHGKY